MPVSIANAAGFLGDNKLVPRQLVEAAEVDFLTLEYLAELTLSILARARQKNPQAGYAKDFVDVFRDLCPALRDQSQLSIVSNGGGMNPTSCVAELSRAAKQAGLAKLPIACVRGDDLMDRLTELQSNGVSLSNLDTGRPLSELDQPIISANAYLGSESIVQALQQQARVVVTGRVADATLTIAPAVFRHGWKWDEWDRLASAAVAGHVIECGAQATGGYSVSWEQYELSDVGYPIATIFDDGRAVISKPAGTGGVVNRQTVVEQLVYEIGDPAHYLTPDVDVDFTSVQVAETGADEVTLSACRGNPAPASLKVSLAYHDGFSASGQLLVYGRDCLTKARRTAEIVFDRVRRAGFELDRTNVELLGIEPELGIQAAPPPMVVLRMAVQDARREAVTCFTEQIAPLITSGPAGLAGYASGRSRVTPMFAFWPALVPRDAVRPTMVVKTAEDWLPHE